MDLTGSVDQLSDPDLLVRMLYFCDQPRTRSQIMSYCSMDGVKLKRFTDHCISKNLLKEIYTGSNGVMYTLTQHGKETLFTAIDLMRELQIDPADIITPKKR
jgi:predicted transcriptional regulator